MSVVGEINKLIKLLQRIADLLDRVLAAFEKDEAAPAN
jgi:hypothetical protein